MAHITFAPAIQRHVPTPDRHLSAASVRAAFDAVFAEQPELRGYILDDQNQLRRHVTVFIDGTMIRDRQRLSDALREDSKVYVVQALSGG
ncbi:MoaD/ThiS family protein [Cupriavidus gilardii]|uniref:MoaD/ThiS family protein n=1 Tax=Cupriavidus gilardii TaxID=82541 RepID=UPI001ABDDE12|nr:MoaD/ThiS family protein [Cupriavidus gilardii]MBO4122081.1 MoaD/ThiS family protein [Cupriavidus gilardii]